MDRVYREGDVVMEQSHMTLLKVDKVLFAVLFLCSKLIGVVMPLILVYLFNCCLVKNFISNEFWMCKKVAEIVLRDLKYNSP